MKQFIVVGLGRFGSSVATTVSENGHEVLAIDQDESEVQNIKESVTHAVQADATDVDALESLGVSEFDVAVVAIGGNIEANILSTLLLKEQGIPHVVAKAMDNLQGKVLSRIGADRVVYPESEMGFRVAHNLISSNVLDYIELAPEYSIVEMVATENMANKTLEELDLRSRFGVSVIGVKRNGEFDFLPGAGDFIEEGDTLLVIGTNDSIEKAKHF